jgi:photosystem II stability/assembly factor-like uncharacterized protein
MDPNDPNTLYAAFWHAYRTPWMLNSGGPGGGLFKTTDGGATWTEITSNAGCRKGSGARSGIAVSPANSARVWAIIENDSGGVYRSDDAGQTWEWINRDRKLRQRAWYYSKIYADPKDTNVVYGLNVQFFRSTDGGGPSASRSRCRTATTTTCGSRRTIPSGWCRPTTAAPT